MPQKDREDHPLVLLDACCLINLLASSRSEEILDCLPYRFATSRLVATQEILTIARDAEENAPLEREAISPARLEAMESLALLDLAAGEEVADFVRLAAELDDGEASVCALAIAREGTVATDDRKALRILSQMAPRVPSLQTPELFYTWARLSRATEREISDVLRAVRRRGRFRPRRDAPRFEWWESYFR